jgi:hypothetical protein
MRTIKPETTRHVVSYITILAVVFCAIMLVPKLSRAHADGNSIQVTNDSSRNMLHLYLSPPNSDKWGADQLNDATISPGGSYTLSNVACPASSIKVVAEDQDGCFVSEVVACTENASWSITNDLTPDCGN